MRAALDRIFFDHPGSVDESYAEHFMFAARFGGALLGAGAAAIIHALVPCLFERTASTTVKRLHAIIVNRGAPAPSPAPRVLDEPMAYI